MVMKLVIYPPVEHQRLERIVAAAETIEVVNAESEEAACAAIADAEAFFGKLTPPLLAAATKLRWVQSPTASLEHYIFPELAEHPLVLTNMRGLYSDVIAEQLADYARVDVCIAGGITETRKIANWAEAYYIRLATHNPLGPVSSAACLQVNLATANVGVQEQPVRPDTLLPDVVITHIDWEDGYLLPTTVPGLGVEFNREAARMSPYRPNETTHLTRRDGSFTNW